MTTIRIATYNIHKCIGMDRRYSPERIADVIRELDADVVALQEVVWHSAADRHRDHQADFLANELGMEFRVGQNRLHKGGEYGNAVLSRLPIEHYRNHDITVKKYEPRGGLRTDIRLPCGSLLQFLNVHMGTSYFERRHQVHRLLAEHVLDPASTAGGRIIAGDFNEWIPGLTTRLLRSRFSSVDPKVHLGRARTFPGIMPLVHLDHIYFDSKFKLRDAFVHRSRKALLASDHLPITAEFEI
ncbi:MAG: endonuclease/exonuclease/phosphatase family protein [Chloracidobacterium sp.]|nr:endonuclease/exonuclease/phosphatase family protein [Chloracidobacterium sp.]